MEFEGSPRTAKGIPSAGYSMNGRTRCTLFTAHFNAEPVEIQTTISARASKHFGCHPHRAITLHTPPGGARRCQTLHSHTRATFWNSSAAIARQPRIHVRVDSCRSGGEFRLERIHELPPHSPQAPRRDNQGMLDCVWPGLKNLTFSVIDLVLPTEKSAPRGLWFLSWARSDASWVTEQARCASS